MTEIRPYREADLDAVIALWQACGLLRPWNPPAADIALLRQSGHGALLVAAEQTGEPGERPERLIGTIMVGHDGHRGWVYYVAVDPGRRRQRLGERLMREAETWLRDRGIRKLELMIRDSNANVAAFYGALGYEREPVIVMSRWLDGTSRA